MTCLPFGGRTLARIDDGAPPLQRQICARKNDECVMPFLGDATERLGARDQEKATEVKIPRGYPTVLPGLA